MKDKYVLDSNVWIEIHRGSPAVLRRTESLIQRNEVCLVDVIVAELLRGVRTKEDYDRLKAAFLDFPVISTSWDAVSSLAFAVSQRGYNPPLVDLYIAQAVLENRKTIITLDRHFLQIARTAPLSVQIIAL